MCLKNVSSIMYFFISSQRGDIDIEKLKFHYSKYIINKNNVDIIKIIVFDKVSFDK